MPPGPQPLDWAACLIAEEKFVDYSMDPSNENSLGKSEAFAALGYVLGSEEQRRTAATDVIEQLRDALPPDRLTDERLSPYGRRFTAKCPLVGPNGTRATLITIWQVDVGGSEPRLITNWAEVHTKGGDDAAPKG